KTFTMGGGDLSLTKIDLSLTKIDLLHGIYA
ncbi:unnamed protein product, partial [Rotaria socialis]